MKNELGCDEVNRIYMSTHKPDVPMLYNSDFFVWYEFVYCFLQDAIVIGHSSGAVAAMRFLEKHKVSSQLNLIVKRCMIFWSFFHVMLTRNCVLFCSYI